jgi:hypothetical protein
MFRKGVSWQQAQEWLRSGEVQLPPLAFEVRELEIPDSREARCDAILKVHWRDRCYDFCCEYKSSSTPKVFQGAVHQVLSSARKPDTYPMVVMPYLSESQLRELEAHEVSGIDLCGNGIVIVPGELLVFRTGTPNKFPQSAPIKNIYRKNSSLVARTFLLRPEFPSVTELHHFVRQRQPIHSREKIALSTVSKVVKSLEDDLIVGRDTGKLRLLQPEKLLDKLAANHQPPEITERYKGRFLTGVDDVFDKLYCNAAAQHLPLIETGSGSAPSYGVMERGGALSFYCTKIHLALFEPNRVPVEREVRFPDIELLQTDDETAYFDIRSKRDFPQRATSFHSLPILASPIQTYLELMAGDERDKTTAQQVRELILRELEEQRA